MLAPLSPMAFLVYLGGVSFNRWDGAARIVFADALAGLVVLLKRAAGYIFFHKMPGVNEAAAGCIACIKRPVGVK